MSNVDVNKLFRNQLNAFKEKLGDEDCKACKDGPLKFLSTNSASVRNKGTNWADCACCRNVMRTWIPGAL